MKGKARRQEPGNWNTPYVPFWLVLADEAERDANRIGAFGDLLKDLLKKETT